MPGAAAAVGGTPRADLKQALKLRPEQPDVIIIWAIAS